MKHKTLSPDTVLLSAILVLALTREAYGYIDPGTGSLIFQVIVGSLLGAAFAIKMFWRQITHFIGRLLRKRKKDQSGES